MDNKINNNNKKTGNRYSIEFKENAVKRKIEKGISAAQCARELGINVNTMREWIKTYNEDNNEPFVGSGNLRSEAMKIKELERENRDLKEELEILKKAAAIFARELKN